MFHRKIQKAVHFGTYGTISPGIIVGDVGSGSTIGELRCGGRAAQVDISSLNIPGSSAYVAMAETAAGTSGK
jgi:hypothetical protein